MGSYSSSKYNQLIPYAILIMPYVRSPKDCGVGVDGRISITPGEAFPETRKIKQQVQ
jgi:hypothetical protein